MIYDNVISTNSKMPLSHDLFYDGLACCLKYVDNGTNENTATMFSAKLQRTTDS